MRGALRKLMYPVRRWPRLSKAALFCGALGVAVVGLANVYVLLSVSGESTADVADVPPAEVAIVPGALVQPDGKMSAMLADRVTQAAALWKAGKVKRILVSGDHHEWGYDEPDTMRKSLVADGVPPKVIFEDHAGLDTWATMVRARSIFQVHSAVVVTQNFHMPRALYLADAAGMGASGGDQHGPRVPGAGQGGCRHDSRHAGDGRPVDPDHRRRRPRQLGTGASARHAAGRLTRRLSRSAPSTGLVEPEDPPGVVEPLDQAVDLFAGRVGAEAGAGGGGDPEAFHQRLRAVVPGADSDTVAVEDLGDVVGVDSVDFEGDRPEAIGPLRRSEDA
jgi:SanA protein